MEDNKDKPTVSITIHDSNVQVLPNATEATMNFYGDQFAPPEYRHQESAVAPAHAGSATASPAAAPAPQQSADAQRRSEAVSTLRIHITDEQRLNNYLQCLANSHDASQLAQIALSMQKNEHWPDEVEIRKERFINLLKALAPKVTKGNTVSNIRARIKALS